ncbi:Zn-ribbon domain-containing OB-fold protein [Desulfofundulus thermocisternus]|uniref:Zn-ribbon domain-containing OB-fold protein n=1 Tax=Desulfofundulus thermocisternus TaxID=42471 RepID=UPI0019F201CA|nr:OB-fold domain-containing protein [Desulfofundulus thermocisternus]MBE3586037.1 OB-fold domain-containing protein [Thermoanaerobacter sp.]MCS5695031.1 OB-fold domain-containing protein [Desulfofundulus thermocisternus]
MSTIEYRRMAVDKLQLHGYRCLDCGSLHPWWEKYCCGRCASRNLERVNFSGRARVNHLGVVYYPPTEFKGEEPYILAELKLEEGMLISGRMVKMPLDELAVGDEVRATIRRIKLGDEGEIYYGIKFEKAGS